MVSTRTVKFEIIGDASSGDAAVLKFAESIDKANAKAVGANVTWAKMYGDLDKVKAAAASAAAATDKLANVGSGKSGLMTGIENLLRMSGNSQASSAAFNAVADGLDQVGGKAILAGAGIAVAGAAVVKLGLDATKTFIGFAEQVRQFQAVSGATAEQSSVLINMGQLLGISAETMSHTVGMMATNMDVNKTKLAELGIEVVKNKDGNTDLVATYTSVIEKLHDMTDAQARDVAAKLALGRSWQSIGVEIGLTKQQMEDLRKSAEKGPILNQANEDAAIKLKESMGTVTLEVKKLEIGLAEAFGPVVLAGIKVTEFTIHQVEDAIQSVIDSLQAIAKVGAALHLPGMEAMYDALKGVDVAGQGAADGTTQAAGAVENLGTEATITEGKLYTLADAYTSVAKSFSEQFLPAQTLGIAATDKFNTAVASVGKLMDTAAQDTSAAADTMAQGARTIADAQQAIGDAEQKVVDAQAAYTTAVSDAALSVANAQESYARAVEDSAKSAADAEEAASKSIISAEKAVMDARQAAADQAVSSARSVADAQQGLLDAESAALREANPFAAQRLREDAALKLTRAQEDAGRAAEKSAQGIVDAQGKLKDTEETAQDNIAKAHEDAARRIEDSQKAVAAATEAASKQIAAAHKAVVQAEDEVIKKEDALVKSQDSVAQANERARIKVAAHTVTQGEYDSAVQATIDATPGMILDMASRGATWDQIKQKIQDTSTALHDQGIAMGENTTLADILGQNADEALLKVLGLNEEAYAVSVALATITRTVGSDLGSVAADFGSLGVDPLTGKSTHDQGGWLMPGVTLAVNRTGVPERVLAPGQHDSGGGTTVVVNVGGSIISERDLAGIVRNVVRNGYVGV